MYPLPLIIRIIDTCYSTSPSLYLQLMGTAAVSDRCTTVGSKLINPVITLPPNGLFTWKPRVNQWDYDHDNFTVGEVWHDPSGVFNEPIENGINQLDLKDLACPTWGLGKSTAANGTVITTIGPPWLPLIVPPFDLFSLDPTWAALCTGILTDQFDLTTFALFDPPIALTPAAVLASTPLVLPTRTPVPTPADPTTVPDPVKSSSTAAKPASILNDPVAAPATTEKPEKAIPTQSPVINPSGPDPLPDISAVSSKNGDDPPSAATSNSKVPLFSAVPGDLPVESIARSSSALDLPLGISSNLASKPKVPSFSAIPEDPPASSSIPSSDTLYPTLRASPKSPSKTKVPPSSAAFEDPPAESFTPSSNFLDPPSGSSQGSPSKTEVPSFPTVSGDPSASSVIPSSDALDPLLGASHKSPSRTKVPFSSEIPGVPPVGPIAASSSAADPPLDDSQKPASDHKLPIAVPIQGDTQAQTQGLGAIIYNAFGKSGSDDDGAKGEVNTVPLPPQSIFTIGAQTFTANPTGFSFDNTVISPGDTAHTVDGTIISLDQSGVLAIGSSTVSLTNPSSTTVLAVAGQTFTPNPSAFSIAGSLISAGGPTVAIDGTTVSLDRSGALAIGSTTIFLTDPWPMPFAPEAFTVAGQTFTPNPSAFAIAGTTVSADGPAITVSGTIVSLGQSGALRIGSSTIFLASPPDPAPSKVYTVAGQKFTPNPSAFPIANSIVSAGGPAVTVDGTIISLGHSGALAIGSSTINLPIQLHTPYNKAYTIAGQTFTPNPSAFPIANTTISAGGPAATIDGTFISLDQSGTLLLGSSTISLPISQATLSSDITIDGFHIQAQQSSFVVVDGVTLSAAEPGVTISGAVLSLENGGKTVDVDGTGRFALPVPVPTPMVKEGFNGSESNVLAFTGGQGKAFSSSVSLLLLCGIWGIALFAGVGVGVDVI